MNAPKLPLSRTPLVVQQNHGFQPNVGFGYEDAPQNGVQDPTLQGKLGGTNYAPQFPQGQRGAPPQYGVPGAAFALQGGNNAYGRSLLPLSFYRPQLDPSAALNMTAGLPDGVKYYSGPVPKMHPSFTPLPHLQRR